MPRQRGPHLSAPSLRHIIRHPTSRPDPHHSTYGARRAGRLIVRRRGSVRETFTSTRSVTHTYGRADRRRPLACPSIVTESTPGRRAMSTRCGSCVIRWHFRRLLLHEENHMFCVPGHFMRVVTNAQLAITRAMTHLTRINRQSVALPRQQCRNAATPLHYDATAVSLGWPVGCARHRTAPAVREWRSVNGMATDPCMGSQRDLTRRNNARRPNDHTRTSLRE